MEKRILETVLADQAEELALARGRDTVQRVEEALVDLDSPQAQVVIGVRRSGKSTLCLNVLRRSGRPFAYVNFDDERLVGLHADDLNDVLEVLYKIYGDFHHLFIDEIQNIDGWHLFVNRLLRRQMHVLVTGSNAKLLSAELATHLTGRHHAIRLFPFSFAEHCALRHVDTRSATTKAVAERRAAFDDYLRQGGFPELYALAQPRDYVDTLVESILKHDIGQRYRISHLATFTQLAHHLLNVAPTIVVEKSLRATFGLGSDNTVKNYVSYLRQAFLIIAVHKYADKSRQRVIGEKIYPIDVALMDKRADAFARENLGWRLETIVALHLLRYSATRSLDLYYLTDRTAECDFLLCHGARTLLAVQVAYDISTPRTLRRELNGLALAARRTRCQHLYLLTDHTYDDLEHDTHTIAVRPVYDFLLHMDDIDNL